MSIWFWRGGAAGAQRGKSLRARLQALWPHAPLAAFLASIGLLNIIDGLSLPLNALQRIRALNGLAESLSAVGGTAQVLLGVMLVIVGLGLMWRLVSAWTFSVLLLVVTLALDVAREQWGTNFVLQLLILGVLLFVKRHFRRRTALASVVFSLANIFAILAYGALGSYLLGNGFRPQIQDLSSACYFTVVTLSTVGYGDITPVTSQARWFVVSLLVFGLGVFASAIASALGPKISGELNRIFNPEEKHMKPKNHIIVVGDGSIARNTVQELTKRDIAFVHIVTARSEPETASVQTIVGDGTSDEVLRQAGIEHARMIIAAREDDGENAFISLGAKDLNPDIRVLAVASAALSIRRLKLARADLVFSPSAVGSRLLADLVQGSEISREFQDLLEGSL